MAALIKTVGLIIGLLTPALALAAKPNFEAARRELSKAWSTSPAECGNPTPQVELTSDAEVSALKSALKDYQVCLKAAVTRIQDRRSAEAMVDAPLWAGLDETQRAALQDTLEVANREVVRGLIAEGVAVAKVSSFALSTYKTRKKIEDDKALMRACGPRYELFLDRRSKLESDDDLIGSIGQRLSALKFSIDLGKGMAGAGMADQGRLRSQIAEYDRQVQQYQRRNAISNERREAFEREFSTFKEECLSPKSAIAVDEVCEDSDLRAYCQAFRR
jgi:hypothetical protein